MTDQPTIGVLALQGDFHEHLRMLRGAGAVATSVRRRSELAAVDGLVIPGGESTTMMKLAAAFDLLDPLRERLAAGMPAFGTCAGMILLADTILDGAAGQPTLGGLDAKVRRNAFGRQVDSFEADVSVAVAGDRPFHAVFIRAPWVESTGTGVEVIGAVDDASGASRIVAVRTGRLLATSFHPELTGDDRIHRLFVDMVKGQ